MKFTSKGASGTVALAIALVAGSAAMLAAPAAAAKKEEAPKPGNYKLSKDVQPLLADAQKALAASDTATADTKITAAEAAAKTEDDKFIAGQLRVNLGIQLKNEAMQAKGIDGMIASGKAPADLLPKLLQNGGVLAYNAKDYGKAQTMFARLAEVDPNNADNLINLAAIAQQSKQPAQALTYLDKAVAARKATGQPVPEDWYKRGQGIAYDAKLGPQTVQWSQALVTAYPTPDAWRTALILYRDSARLDDQSNLDLMRLMFDAKALKGERDYVEYADTAFQRGFPGEAKAVLDQGTASNMLPATSKPAGELKTLSAAKIDADRKSLPASEAKAKSAADGRVALNTADAYLSYGDNAKAIEFYRLAMQKGGVDANVVNTRLGIAFSRSGQKAEAVTAFKAVTGARQPIAEWWTLYVNQKA